MGDLVLEVEKSAALLKSAREAVGTIIIGQEEVVDKVFITLLSGAHGLLVGLPGLAKTKLVETFGVVLGLKANRIQFTPDLMPSDILGSEVLEEHGGKRSFRFIEGPIFAELLMGDEINRASPRTQSALLQAMQEKIVTYAGVTYALPSIFNVLATQNPLEQEGTYPLPEAQLDRFLMQIDVGYPTLLSERAILLSTTGIQEAKPKAVMAREDLLEAQSLVRQFPIGEDTLNAILTLTRSLRPKDNDPHISWGPGPRAGQALMLATRARALLEGRYAATLEDVHALAPSILKHRMAVTYAARSEGVSVETLITSALKAI